MAPKRRIMMIKLLLKPGPTGVAGASARNDSKDCEICILDFVLN